MLRYKIVICHEINSNGEIVGIEYAVVCEDSNGFEQRMSDWTPSLSTAQAWLALYLKQLARAS